MVLILLIVAVVTALALLNLAVMNSFWRREAWPRWWVSLVIAWAAGSGLGAWGGLYTVYQPAARLRVVGAPIPAAFFHWEGPPGQERWVDFITPAPLLFASSNVVIVGLLAACPIGLAFRLGHRSRDIREVRP